MKKLLLLLLTLMVVTSFAETPPMRGTITSNIKLTDLDGKTYDLFEILESGKHVYVQTVFND